MSRMTLPMVLERERVAKLKKAQQDAQKQAQKPAAGGVTPMVRAIGGAANVAGRIGSAVQTGATVARAAGTVANAAANGLRNRRFPTFEAEAAHARQVQGPSQAAPLPALPASATPPQVGPTKAELTRMQPNDGPQPAAASAPPDDRARLLGREREIRQFLEAQKRNSLVGLSPGFTAEDAAAANQTALARDQAKDIALLLREPERRGRSAGQIQSARGSLREQGFNFARQQLEAAIPPERLAQIESGAAVEMTPEERAAIDEFDRIGGGLNRSLPAIPDQIGREMARGEATRAAAANKRLTDQQAALRQEGSTFQTDEAARRDRDLAAVREREIQAALQKAAIAQAQQVGREAGGTSQGVEDATRQFQATEANRAVARQGTGVGENFSERANESIGDLNRVFDPEATLARPGVGVAKAIVPSAMRGMVFRGDINLIQKFENRVAELRNLAEVDPSQASILARDLLEMMPDTDQEGRYWTPASSIESRHVMVRRLNDLRGTIESLARAS